MATSQVQKKSVETPLQSNIDDFYKTLKNKANLLPDICSYTVRKIDLDIGNSSWDSTVGSRKRLTVNLGKGVTMNFKDEVEAINITKRSITFKVVEGQILDRYTSFKATLDVTDAGKAKWTVEFEKKSNDVPDPDTYLNRLASISEAIDQYLCGGVCAAIAK